MCQVASGVSTAARSRSGLIGARLVGKHGPWTTASMAARWIHGRSGRQDGDHLLGRSRARERGEVVGAVDRGAVVHVVRARHQHRPDACLGEAASSAATRSTERFGWTLESNRSPATRNRSTFSSMARSTAARNAANWRSRWAAAASPRSAWRAPRCTSAVCSSRSMGCGCPPWFRPVIEPGPASRTGTRERPLPTLRSRDLGSISGRLGPGRSPRDPVAIRAPPSLPARHPSLGRSL